MKGPSAGVSLTQHQRKTRTVIQKLNKTKKQQKSKAYQMWISQKIIKNNVEKELWQIFVISSLLSFHVLTPLLSVFNSKYYSPVE